MHRLRSPRSLLPSLVLGFGLATLPALAQAAPEEEDESGEEDLEADDELEGSEPDESEMDDSLSEADEASAKASLEFSAQASAKKDKKDAEASAKADSEAKSKRKARIEALDAERKDGKPMQKWAPERHMLHIGVYGGIILPGSDHGFFDPGEGDRPDIDAVGPLIGGRLEYFPIPWVGVGAEGGGFWLNSDPVGGGSTGFNARAHVIAQLHYRLTPMLFIGGGAMGTNSDFAILDSNPRGAFHWGAALKFHAHKWVAIRLDGRQVVADSGASRFSVGEVTLGLDVTLRLRDWMDPDKKKKPRRDTDGDGVLDVDDPCPGTMGSDGHGCPPELRDTDKDGIKDHKDRCPTQWSDTPGGCPEKDSDNDGLPDNIDKCIDEPETRNGWEDSDGCADEVPAAIAQFSGVIRGITFESGKTKIRKTSNRTLKEAVSALKDYPEVRILITGHTDNVGKREDNLDLSKRRAKAVRDHLIKAGIDKSRIETRGAGPDEPVADNATKKGRAENRRIEFQLLN